jgi:Protein of unknown function (DUF3040)
LLHGVRCAIILLVPLSEDEQRILLEIEQRLTEEDPDLVREVASTTVYTHALRNLKLIMLVAALVFERNARRLGKAGLQQLTQSMRGAGVRDYLGATSQRMRDRFKRDDEA